MSLVGIPPIWRALVAEINGARVPDGTPGVRDADAPCESFDPAGKDFEDAPGRGTCETDGHYICRECVHISIAALRRRRDQCEDCGTPLAYTLVSGEHCHICDAERVAREQARETEAGASKGCCRL